MRGELSSSGRSHTPVIGAVIFIFSGLVLFLSQLASCAGAKGSVHISFIQKEILPCEPVDIDIHVVQGNWFPEGTKEDLSYDFFINDKVIQTGSYLGRPEIPEKYSEFVAKPGASIHFPFNMFYQHNDKAFYFPEAGECKVQLIVSGYLGEFLELKELARSNVVYLKVREPNEREPEALKLFIQCDDFGFGYLSWPLFALKNPYIKNLRILSEKYTDTIYGKYASVQLAKCLYDDVRSRSVKLSETKKIYANIFRLAKNGLDRIPGSSLQEYSLFYCSVCKLGFDVFRLKERVQSNRYMKQYLREFPDGKFVNEVHNLVRQIKELRAGDLQIRED